MSEKPKGIVYIRPDTIGDLIIFQSALARLQAAWPDAQHTLVVRPGYDSLAPLFPPTLRWLTVPLNPFTDKPSDAHGVLASLFEALDQQPPDIVVAPTLNRTWLEVVVAAHFPHARRVALGNREVDPLFANALRLKWDIDSSTVFTEQVAADEKERDWENNHRLVDQLLGLPSERVLPQVSIPADAATLADEVLSSLGLGDKPWAAVFAGGLANVPIKAWPANHFGTLVHWLQGARNLPVLLLGHESEEKAIDAVREAAVNQGAASPAVWLGKDGGIPLLAALLQRAALYVGHDTGAMHLAAAAGRPVVGIFGGGHWPRFRPVGQQVISVVQPLPCFGCNWDCRFENAPCVKTLGVANVQQGVDQLLAASSSAIDAVVEARNLSAESIRLIAAVTPRYEALQKDRLERQHTIEELKRDTDTKDLEIDALKKAAEERKTEMEAIKAELEAECAEKDVEIADLKGETNVKDEEITQLKGAANTKDSEISALKDVCNEREALIFTQAGHIKTFQRMVSEHQETATALQVRIKQLEDAIAAIPPDVAQNAKDLKAKDVHIFNIEGILETRNRDIAALQASVANYALGLGSLEQSKHYGKLLAEKEDALQTLNRACIEREAVIQQLALEATGFGGKLFKLWTAVREHGRLKYWVPFNEWLFKKVVDDHWMQIGILKHYEPRPIVWEKFPKSSLPDAKIPRIGIVTPSYGQATFLESTLLSVLNQKYSKLNYVVQDGGSKDASPQIIERYAGQLHHWECAPDKGQADAIRKGFLHLSDLAPSDLMAWINSDDLIVPRALRFVAEYFARHPDVDVVYGHRIIIDGHDREIGRWIMPNHDTKTLEWIDYVPQETLFWRKRVWDLVGGIDPSFQFALDWDLLARFQQAKAKIVRLPYFLGCFRVHAEQKTSQHIHTIGNEEMIRIRSRFHGERHNDFKSITHYARRARFRGALTARLVAWGIRF